MKYFFSLFLAMFLITGSVLGQNKTQTPSKKEPLYHPEADAAQELENAMAKAKTEGKNIFIQIGGNWCSWCYLFHEFCKADDEITALIEENYVSMKLNYSRENDNREILKQLRYPNRFGFPVFVILDSDGNYLHTQNTVYLEEGKGYSKKRVMEFLKGWSPEALNPDNYFKN